MNTVCNTIARSISAPLKLIRQSIQQFHNLPRVITPRNHLNQVQVLPNSVLNQSQHIGFLQPITSCVLIVRSFKVRYVLKKRCKDCYFAARDGRNYVLCPTHGRHKQMSMLKQFKNWRILTHATQSKYRPW
uniref:Ribosomal protein n=1 Tax=Clastoptera arizonana TaxID=38151 RepID=A0A1B6DHN0_9HEMI